MGESVGAEAPHHPYYDVSQRVDGFQHAVRCLDCHWSQIVDEDLHEERENVLLAWHAAHPEEAVDHLTLPPTHVRLAVPTYALWKNDGYGCALVSDTRTRPDGGAVRYNHECLMNLQRALSPFPAEASSGLGEDALAAESAESGAGDVHRGLSSMARAESLTRRPAFPAAPTDRQL
ncbi:hypothetical protein ADK57_03165 [Streptomyces sp. MMG1533]|nr:hypothetical protein ADK57_03165 [Streptomyces sp. MMG1533]